MLLTLGLGGAALALPSFAAGNPACAATVTHDVKLTSDINCPGSYGILVGKAGITINLNGHAIRGPSGKNGIEDAAGYDKVTLENGTIANFDRAVFFGRTTGTRILHVKALDPGYGLDVEESLNAVIDHSTGSHNIQAGIYLSENSKVKVTNSVSSHNGHYGVYDYQSLATLDNVTANTNDPNNYADGGGVYVDYPVRTGSSYYTIENSTATNNFRSGFYIAHNYPANLHQAVVRDNEADVNGEYGFYADAKTLGKRNNAAFDVIGGCYHVTCG